MCVLFCVAVRRHVVRLFDILNNRKFQIIGSGYFRSLTESHSFHRKNQHWTRKVIDFLNFSIKIKIEIQGFILKKKLLIFKNKTRGVSHCGLAIYFQKVC